MPPNTRGYLVRRCHQADEGIKRAERYLASMVVTLRPQHPELAEEICGIIGRLDETRNTIANLLAVNFSASTRKMWTPRQLGEILLNAKPVPQPEKR